MGCHYIFDGKGARGMTREEKEAFARKVLGDDVYDALVLRTHQPSKRVERVISPDGRVAASQSLSSIP